MKDVEKSRTSFIRVNLRALREKHLFQCPPLLLDIFFLQKVNDGDRISIRYKSPAEVMQSIKLKAN